MYLLAICMSSLKACLIRGEVGWRIAGVEVLNSECKLTLFLSHACSPFCKHWALWPRGEPCWNKRRRVSSRLPAETGAASDLLLCERQRWPCLSGSEAASGPRSFESHSRSQPPPSLPLPCDGAMPRGRQGWCVLPACVRACAVAVWMLSGVGAASAVLPE